MKLQDIIQQNLVKPIDSLAEDPELCRQIQSRLNDLGLLLPEEANGIYSPQTQHAFAQFKQATKQGDPDKLGPGSVKALIELKKLPGGGDLQPKNLNLDKIPSKWKNAAKPYVPILVKAFQAQGIDNPKVFAYACATICHESSWNPKAKNTTDAAAKSGYPGAGLAQITWKDNYKAVGDATGIDFVNHPEYMFNPAHALQAKAAFYKLHGMIPYIEKNDYESAAGIYNAGKASFRSSYTKKVANDTPWWIPVF
jgi:predicted chitinase